MSRSPRPAATRDKPANSAVTLTILPSRAKDRAASPEVAPHTPDLVPLISCGSQAPGSPIHQSKQRRAPSLSRSALIHPQSSRPQRRRIAPARLVRTARSRRERSPGGLTHHEDPHDRLARTLQSLRRLRARRRGPGRGPDASPPKVLVIQREYLKPGKAGAIHVSSEANFVRAVTDAKWPTHYIAMDSMSGPTRALYMFAYDSFGA